MRQQQPETVHGLCRACNHAHDCFFSRGLDEKWCDGACNDGECHHGGWAAVQIMCLSLPSSLSTFLPLVVKEGHISATPVSLCMQPPQIRSLVRIDSYRLACIWCYWAASQIEMSLIHTSIRAGNSLDPPLADA